ncbi:hypothetical protein GCM10009765_59940 [Fodinicola feengrottensis]|uniref:Uncharacterized protein n=1 Tax=Fodinicola feengrottensis TaxID=435914 RepID=A0ABN2ID55_9ACTN
MRCWTDGSADPDGAQALRSPSSTPMLITVRVTYDSMSGQTLALEQIRRSADDVQLMYWLAAFPSADSEPVE